MSSKTSLWTRIKRMSAIIFPLLFSAWIVSMWSAMPWSCGALVKIKNITWYMGKKLVRNDYLTIGFAVVFMAVALTITFADGSRFWNPFQ